MKKEILGFTANNECEDRKCPFHGSLNVKKELLKGVVVKMDINHSATITWLRSHFVPKYERFEVRRSRLRVHAPPCMDVKIGDNVVVARTRPISKTKNHVIIGKVEGKSKKEMVVEEARLERKKKTKVENESHEE
jgi:small subunit ribosomal protein S17